MNKSKSKNNNIFNNNRLMTIEYDCPIQPKLNNKKESVQRKGQSSSKKQATLKKNNTLKNFYDQAMNSKKK